MTVKELENGDFQGPDYSLEISLKEYGIAWQKTEFPERTEYKFLYGIDVKENEFGDIEYSNFDYSFMDKKEFESLVNELWFDVESVLSFIGTEETKEEFIDRFPYSVADCVSYHGYENIFGSSYTEGITID